MVLFFASGDVFSSGVLVREGLSIDDFPSVKKTIKKKVCRRQRAIYSFQASKMVDSSRIG